MSKENLIQRKFRLQRQRELHMRHKLNDKNENRHFQLKRKLASKKSRLLYESLHTRKLRLEKRRQKSRGDKCNIESAIQVFRKNIKEGPYYVCVVCNRMLYKISVKICSKEKYPVRIHDIFTGIISYDNKEYICNTCHNKMKKGNIPCQAVCNEMELEEIPPELKCLKKLESILISKRISFQKVVVMPKGRQRKVQGVIVNVPIACDTVCQNLPRPSECSGVILLKLKRKLQYQGHERYEAVRPVVIQRALEYLKCNNRLYSDIRISISNADDELLTIGKCEDHWSEMDGLEDDANEIKDNAIAGSEIDNDDEGDNNDKTRSKSCSKKSDGFKECADDMDEEQEDPQNINRCVVNETCLQSWLPNYPANIYVGNSEARSNRIVSTGNEIYSIAPGEGKHPVHFMNDVNCEELTFPVLFPTGKYGYQIKRQIPLTPPKYFNARLLNYTGRFAQNTEYLFFAQYVTEQKKVQDSISIALRKVHGHVLTASEVRNINSSSFQNLLFADQAYVFMKNIPGMPSYWKRFMYEVIAMIKQLGPPSWWMTLSCADLKWTEIHVILSNLGGEE